MENSQILAWYNRAQIDYVDKYMALYASFNAWYRGLTGKPNDREALNILRRTHTVWHEYKHGGAMYQLGGAMRQLVEFTQREPLSHTTPHWKGEVMHIYDWESVIEYWYRVRCLVMHGAEINPTYVYLAYETLNVFMSEIISRTSD